MYKNTHLEYKIDLFSFPISLKSHLQIEKQLCLPGNGLGYSTIYEGLVFFFLLFLIFVCFVIVYKYKLTK